MKSILARIALISFLLILFIPHSAFTETKIANDSDAVAAYSKAIKINPKDAAAYYNRGLAYHKLGNYKQAIKDYDKAIDFNSKYAEAYRDRGAVYITLGNYKQAIMDCDKTIELEPKNATAYYNRGLAYGKLGNLQQTLNDFKIAAKLGDETAQDILNEQGIAWAESGDKKSDNDTSNEAKQETITFPLIDLYKKDAELGDSYSQYVLAEKYISGTWGVEKNRHLAEKWLIQSILNDNKNKKSIDLLEKEFNWHCILHNNGSCMKLINEKSIIHDNNLSWYWMLGLMRFEKNENIYRVILKEYDVMNCNNKTIGYKMRQALNEDLNLIRNMDVTVKDNDIEFKPIEPSEYNDRLFNYVCKDENNVKNNGDTQEVFLGTGWPIQFGYIVTNQHVINGKKKITAILSTGKNIPATILIEDKINDLALLQVNNPKYLPDALPLSNSVAKTGAKVFTIGYPHPDIMGQKAKLSEGIINADTGYMDDARTLQISVPIQSGNSGGPLLNMNGEVVGIVTSKLSAVKMFKWTGDLPQNVNYAIKISYLNALLNSIKQQSSRIKVLPTKQADLESLATRIQNSMILIIAE